MADTILNGDVTVHYNSENGQKRLEWTGIDNATRTLNEVYSALQSLFDDSSQMDDLIPMRADTPTIYRMINQWFVDDTTVEHLTGGSLYTSGWVEGANNHVRVIGYSPTTEFNAADIGQTIVGGTTGDTGTILDFNTDRNLIWIRPDDPGAAGDLFDDFDEAYTLQNQAFGQVWQVDDTPADTAFVDETTDANSAANADWTIFTATEAVGDYVALGFFKTFSQVTFDGANGTAGVGGVVTWEYWDGTAWVALAGVTDGTTGFTAAVSDGQDLTFTVPDDWTTRTLNGSADLYYVRARITTVYTTNPVYDQGFVTGVGAGSFATHDRHGAASEPGESGWVGITTIGTQQADTHNYIFQEDADKAQGSYVAEKVTKTKATDDYWEDGPLDLLLKTKEADSLIGPATPTATTLTTATFLARQATKTYSDFVAVGLATAGGNTVVPFATGDDLNDTVGNLNVVFDAGDTGATLVDEELLYNVGTNTGASAGNLDAAVQDDGGAFTDDTTDANDTGGAGDVDPFPATEAINDAFYIGKANTFTLLLSEIQTQGVSSAAATAWEYWNGSAWTAVTGLIDDSDTGNGAWTAAAGRHVTQWTLPTDWVATTVTNQPGTPALYYIRVRITAANYSTVPVLETLWVGGEAQLKARVADTTITGASLATGNFDIYELGEPLTTFADNDVVIAGTSRKNFDVNGAPTNTGPANDGAVTFAFGASTEDINNGNGARPYSVRINPASIPIQRVFQRAKYITRRGSTTALLGQDGEEYLGNELQIEYSGQTGNFVEGTRLYDQTTDAEGIMVADHDDGATGDVILKRVRGTFTAGNVLSDSPDPSQTLGRVWQVDITGPTFVDETTDAGSAGGADVLPFPASEAVGDYFAVGCAKVFSQLSIDIATSGVGGVGLWEYWNGTAWTDLEATTGFTDNTSDLTAAPGISTLVFGPPLDWTPTTLNDEGDPLYYVRLRITTVYSTNPILDEVQALDNATATIDSTRTIVPVSASPFGTFAGGTMFLAPGVILTTANLFAGDEQAYQAVDDNGVTQIPPNTVSVTVTNLVSGDAVAVFRRTGAAVDKTDFTTSGGANNLGNFTLTVNTSVSTEYPPSGKVRVISTSGVEHRYRYSSIAGAVFTLPNAYDGVTADAGGDVDTIIDATSTFQTDGVEVGDWAYNVTTGEGVRITAVVSETELTTEALTVGAATWASAVYDINSLQETYADGRDVYVPFIEREADAASESNTMVHSTDVDVKVVVRNAGVILPFDQDTAIVSTGLSVSAIRTSDDIFT